jgi:hypothetical protein
MSGEEATVDVTCTSGGSEKSAPCTFLVARDGTVRPSLAMDPGQETRPATTVAQEASERAKTLMFVQHVFGQGLHKDKLEPGREYTMPGSFHSFDDASLSPATARDVGAPERPRGVPEGGRTAASSGTAAGTHAIRHEGTATCHGQLVAVFGIAHGKGIGTERSEPAARPGEGRPAVTLPGKACAGCSGKAAYRISDGLLEAMAFEGSSVLRTDARRPSLGN